jgi:FAD-dependent oxidoreductase domain-containing protein 1
MAEGADIVRRGRRRSWQKRFAWLSTEGISRPAPMGRHRRGLVRRPRLCCGLFRKALKTAGASTSITASVTGIERHGNRVAAVHARQRRAAGGRHRSFNAAGPNAGKVSAMAGHGALPVEPRKRNGLRLRSARDRFADMPLLVDPSGVYVRPEGSVYIAGGAESGGWRTGPADPARISTPTGACSRR